MSGYYKEFATETEAQQWARIKTRAARDHEIFCVLEGPDNNWVVADLRTAIGTGLPYSWAA